MNPLNLKSKLVYGGDRPLVRKPDTDRYLDPDEPLAGKCMSCKNIMGCLRKDALARAPKYGEAFPEPGTWADLLSAECPNCGARVFVMNAKELKNIVSS